MGGGLNFLLPKQSSSIGLHRCVTHLYRIPMSSFNYAIPIRGLCLKKKFNPLQPEQLFILFSTKVLTTNPSKKFLKKKYFHLAVIVLLIVLLINGKPAA